MAGRFYRCGPGTAFAVWGRFFSGYGPDFFIAGVAVVYFINLVQLVFFTRSGFLAMLTIRLAMYLVWHVLWGPLRLWLLY